MSRQPLDATTIVSRLNDYLEAEFTFIRTDQLAAVLAGMPRDRQDFVLEWTRRAAATNTELAFQFANRAKEALLEAEREALILLAEALNTLGDRYAIYGFSGWTRKRCEAFRVKGFDDPWDDLVIGRVCGIEPKDYTRMGAPIRHLAHKLKEIEARTKLLVTLSDGKPDDYDLEYRGEYGIEDTRQALLEARREGIHAYCITIDREGQDYLPHMYGAANYTVLDDVAKLPLKVSDIYREITT